VPRVRRSDKQMKRHLRMKTFFFKS
jgi:hypothetical protein